MKTRDQRRRGLSLLEVVFVMVTLVLVGGLFLPKILRPKARACPRITCGSNLKQIGLAYRLFSNDHNDLFPFAVLKRDGGTLEFTNSPQVSRHFEVMSNELVWPRVLVCPQDRGRTGATNFETALMNANVSYFAGLDADEAKPDLLLSGDRNITGGRLRDGFLRLLRTNSNAGWTASIHTNAGTIGFADGSAQQATPAELRAALQKQSLPVVRLAIP
jgi:hypothetical protein